MLWFVGVLVFLAGYLCGAILHLVEDSCTKTGIQWNFPFQDWKVTGQLTTTARPEDVRYQQGFLTVIGVCVGGAFFVPTVVDQYPAWMFSAVGFLVAVLLWVGFASGWRSVRWPSSRAGVTGDGAVAASRSGVGPAPERGAGCPSRPLGLRFDVGLHACSSVPPG